MVWKGNTCVDHLKQLQYFIFIMTLLIFESIRSSSVKCVPFNDHAKNCICFHTVCYRSSIRMCVIVAIKSNVKFLVTLLNMQIITSWTCELNSNSKQVNLFFIRTNVQLNRFFSTLVSSVLHIIFDRCKWVWLTVFLQFHLEYLNEEELFLP